MHTKIQLYLGHVKKKDLRICFGVHDFFCFQNNDRELLLPLFVLFGYIAVRLIGDPNQTHGGHSVKCTYRGPKSERRIKIKTTQNLKIC